MGINMKYFQDIFLWEKEFKDSHRIIRMLAINISFPLAFLLYQDVTYTHITR